jgi:hypothetical protein
MKIQLRVVMDEHGDYRVERKGLWFWRLLDFEDFAGIPGLPYEPKFGYGLEKWTSGERAALAADRYRTVRSGALRRVVAEVD